MMLNMLEIIQKTLLADIKNGTRNLAPFLDEAIPNIDERIDIFIGNRRFGHLEYLKSIYPICLQIMGTDFFDQVCFGFIDASWQKSGNRHEFGGEFAGFLAQHQSIKPIKYTSEIAQIEWAHFCASIANDDIALTLETLGGKIANGSKFGIKFVESCTLMAHSFNAIEIWREHQKPSFDEIALCKVKSNLLCWRGADDEILFSNICDEFAALLANPNLGSDFTATLEQAINTCGTHEKIKSFQEQFAATANGGAFKFS